MYRSHTCGELRSEHIGTKVTLAGWMQRSRDLGGMTFIDLRDRYGLTQLMFNMEINAALCEQARKLGREFVIQVEGEVIERSSKNKNMSTGDIEINVSKLTVLNASKLPPFTIEDETGYSNLGVFEKLFETYPKEILHSRLLMEEGRLQREGQVHVIVSKCFDFTFFPPEKDCWRESRWSNVKCLLVP